MNTATADLATLAQAASAHNDALENAACEADNLACLLEAAAPGISAMNKLDAENAMLALSDMAKRLANAINGQAGTALDMRLYFKQAAEQGE